MLPLIVTIGLLGLLYVISSTLKNHLYQLFFIISKNQKVTISLLSLLLFPGTVVHELAHLLTAGILFVPVGHMELVPQVVKGTIRAGSVQIGKTDPFRQTVVGIAPLFAGLAALYCIMYFFFPTQLPFTVDRLPFAFPSLNYSLPIYLIFTISTTMFSSQKDMDAAKVVLPVIIILGISAYIAGVKLPDSLLATLSTEITGVIQNLNLALAISLMLHAALFALLYLLRHFTKSFF